MKDATKDAMVMVLWFSRTSATLVLVDSAKIARNWHEYHKIKKASPNEFASLSQLKHECYGKNNRGGPP